VLNALNQKLTKELLEAAETFDRDPTIGCIVITGSEKAFAAGADITEMQDQTYTDMYANDWFSALGPLGGCTYPARCCGSRIRAWRRL
jgi:enoyl-CoA hydratase